MQKIDANVLLRYVLNDHSELSPRAKEVIDRHIVEVPVEVLAEAVYVLTGHYEIDRQSVNKELKRFFEQTQCILSHRGAVLRGIDFFGASPFGNIFMHKATSLVYLKEDPGIFRQLQRIPASKRLHSPQEPGVNLQDGSRPGPGGKDSRADRDVS